MVPDLTTYDHIVINTSAGKDSQAMMDYVVEQADAAGVPRSRLVAMHCDLGATPGGQLIEWPGTLELALEHAEHYGLRCEVVKRRVRGFLEEILKRGFWPSSTERYCTSYFKRDQGNKLITLLAAAARSRCNPRPRILNCFGFRAQESTRRRKLVPFTTDKRTSNGVKQVDVWLPVHGWLVEEVWARIKRAGTRHHWAYDKGMSRLSCRL